MYNERQSLKNQTHNQHERRLKHLAITFDFSALRGRIITRYGNYAAFAEAVGMSRAQVSERLKGIRAWKPDEIVRICDASVLDIPQPEIGFYFFTPQV